MTVVGERSRRGRVLGMVVLGAFAALVLAVSAGPAAATPAPVAAVRAPSATARFLPAVSGAPGAPGEVRPAATYVQNTYLAYWGADALVGVSSGKVSLGVFCTGWGWYQSSWMGTAPDGTPGYWHVRIDCGSYIPATQYRYQTQG